MNARIKTDSSNIILSRPMFNEYFGWTESPNLEFLNFIVEVVPRYDEDYIREYGEEYEPSFDADFLDFIWGDGQ